MKCVCRRARRPGSRQIEISKAGRPPVRPPIQISTKLSSAGCRARRPGRFEIIRILIFFGGGPFETQFKTNGCFMIRKTRWFSVRFRMGPGRIWNAIFSTRFGRFRGQSDAAIYIYTLTNSRSTAFRGSYLYWRIYSSFRRKWIPRREE